MTLPSEAAFLACRDFDSIIHLIHANRLHVRYVEKKGLFVCLMSLCLEAFRDEIKVPQTDFSEKFKVFELGTADSSYDLVFRE